MELKRIERIEERDEKREITELTDIIRGTANTCPENSLVCKNEVRGAGRDNGMLGEVSRMS